MGITKNQLAEMIAASVAAALAGSPAATAAPAATTKVRPGDAGYVPKAREVVKVTIAPDKRKGQTFAPFDKVIVRPIGSTQTMPNRFNGIVALSAADMAALHSWAKSTPAGQTWAKGGGI